MNTCAPSRRPHATRLIALLVVGLGIARAAGAEEAAVPVLPVAVVVPVPTDAAVPTPEPAVSLSGFILPRFILSSRPAGSFGYRTLQAPTMAFPRDPLVDQLGADAVAEGVRSAWSVAQSRLALNWKVGPALRTKLEVDFFDPSQPQPTVAARPRLRVAAIRLQLGEHVSLMAGQDWDLLAPLIPFTYNVVGAYFTAGNVGFLRQQLRLEVRGEAYEAAVGLAMPGNSGTGTGYDGTLGRGAYPLANALVAWTPGRHRVGLSGLGGVRGYVGAAGGLERVETLAANLFADLVFEPGLLVRGEFTYGRNLGDTGALALSQRRPFGGSEDELDGFISFQYKPHAWALFGGAGVSYIVRPSQVLPYFDSRLGTSSVAQNLTAKLGVSYELFPRLNAFLEYAFFHTKYAADLAGRYFDTQVHVPELGLHWNFG